MARLDNTTRQKFLGYMNNNGGFTGEQFKQFQADEQGFAGGFPDFAKMGQQPAPAPAQPPPTQQSVRPLTKTAGSTDTGNGPIHLTFRRVSRINDEPGWEGYTNQGYTEAQMRDMMGVYNPGYQNPSLQPRQGQPGGAPNSITGGAPNSITGRDPFFGSGRGAGGNAGPSFDPGYGDDPNQGLPGDPSYDNNNLKMNDPGFGVVSRQPKQQLTLSQIGDMNRDGNVDFNDFLMYNRTQQTDTREGGGDNPQNPMRQDPTRGPQQATQGPTIRQPTAGGGDSSGGLNYNGIDITDMNGDGKVDFNDFLAFSNRIPGGYGNGQGGQGGGDTPGGYGNGQGGQGGGDTPGSGGGLPGQNGPGFGLDDILNGIQNFLPGWMGTVLDRYQAAGGAGGAGGSATGGAGGTSDANSNSNATGGTSSATGGTSSASIGDINLQLPGLDRFQGGIDAILEALQNGGGDSGGFDADALEMVLGSQIGGVQSGLDDIFSRLSRIEGNQGDGGGFDFDNLPNIGFNGNALTKPAREAGTGIDTTRELGSVDASIVNPEILNTVQSTLMQRLGRPIEEDPRVASQLADLEKSQTDRRNQRIEDLKRMGINADDGNYFSEGDKLGEGFTRERLALLANGENLRNTDLNTGLNLGNIQGGLNTNDARLGLSANELGLRERLGLGGLDLNERGQDISQRGQDANFDLSGARLGLDQLLGVGNLDVRRDEAQSRTRALDAEIENARNARTQNNLANMIALLNGNSGKGLLDRGIDFGKWLFGKKDGE